VALPPRVPDRPDQRGDDLHEAERGRDGRDRGKMSAGFAVFVVFACGMIGAVVGGWIGVSTWRPSPTDYTAVGAFVTGLIIGFVIGGIVGLVIVTARRNP